MTGSRPASPSNWPTHDSRDWRRLAQQAADSVFELWSGGQRFFWATTREKAAGTNPDLREQVFTLARAVEALVSLSDAFPHWQARSREIVGSCARELCEVEVPVQYAEASLEKVVHEAIEAAAIATGLARVAMMSNKDLASNQKQAVEEARVRAADRLRGDVGENLLACANRLLQADVTGPPADSKNGEQEGEPTQVHPYVPYRLIRAIWLTLFVVRDPTDESGPDDDAGVEADDASVELVGGGLSLDADGAGAGAAAEVPVPAVSAAPLSERLAGVRLALAQHVRRRTPRLVADHQLQRVNRHEAVALAFCGAALSIADPSEDRRFIEVALRSCLSAQGADGGWPLTRVPAANSSESMLEITGFEVAASLAEALLGLLDVDELAAERVADGVVSALLAAAAHTDRMVVELDTTVAPRSGWCGELVYGLQAVEILPTIMALEQSVALSRLSAEMRSREALASFDASDTRAEYWPDWIQWNNYKRESEPQDDVHILKWIDEHLVAPRLRDDPPWARRKAEIVLMFGPPGTTKTTIVRSVAVGLGWPLVSLSPGDFIRDGLDLIEAQSTKIFERLHDLTHAVVLFDECDELFRDRGEDSSAGGDGANRGIGAFVTASMLPKLQDLHDRSQVLVFVLTNYYARLDSAIKRLGRVDYKIGVGPPETLQRRTTAFREISGVEGIGAGVATAASEALAAVTNLYNRPELLQAAQVLSGKLRTELKAGTPLSEAKITSLAKAVDHQMRQGLAMTADDFAHFETLANDFSAPHIDPVQP